MDFQTAILYTMLKYTAHASDASEPDRNGRLTTLSKGIADVSNKVTCHDEEKALCKSIFGDRVLMAGMLAYQDYKETTLRYTVQMGKCEKWECDPYRSHGQLLHAARGPWQAHYSSLLSKEQWDLLIGDSYESVYTGALYTSKLFAGFYVRCHGLAGAFSGYAKGGYCFWNGAEERAVGARAAARQIRFFMAKDDTAIAVN